MIKIRWDKSLDGFEFMSIEENPVAKFFKLDETSFVFIDGVEELGDIGDGDFILLEDGFCDFEFCHWKFFVVVFVYFVEDCPVYVVVFDVLN